MPGDLWAANVDKAQISQVIQNLVINATQAMPLGGTLRIEALNAVAEEIAQATGGPYSEREISEAREWLPSSSTPAA